MLAIWRDLSSDERGFVLTAELIIISTVLVLGLITAFAAVQTSVVAEMKDVGNAIGALNQSYCYTGMSSCKSACCLGSRTFGSSFLDVADTPEEQRADFDCLITPCQTPFLAYPPAVPPCDAPGCGALPCECSGQWPGGSGQDCGTPPCAASPCDGAPCGTAPCGAAPCGAVPCGAPGCGAPGCGAPGCGAPGCGAPMVAAPPCGTPGCGAPACGAVPCGIPGCPTCFPVVPDVLPPCADPWTPGVPAPVGAPPPTLLSPDAPRRSRCNEADLEVLYLPMSPCLEPCGVPLVW